MKQILQTQRLTLREMTLDDLPHISKILQDAETMTAYEGPFSDEETYTWVKRQLERYRKEGIGLWAVILNDTGELIGQCGISLQNVEGEKIPEIGYLFNRQYWHKGYAIEAAKACLDYGFNTLSLPELFTIVRDTNIPSMNVAIRNGMVIRKRFIKHFRGIEMPHYLFSIKNGNQISSLDPKRP